MEDIVWKPFTLGDLFKRNAQHRISKSKKDVETTEIPDQDHTIRNITSTRDNNGCSGYLSDEDEVASKKAINFLTLATNGASGGVCFYQSDYFVSTGDNNILEVRNRKLKDLLDQNIDCYNFLAKLISKVLALKCINRFERKVSNDFDREILLLPCLKVNEELSIWSENDEYYTLATNYIHTLMDSAREIERERTIGMCESKIEKYEIEEKKYYSSYLEEKEYIKWIPFSLDDLFKRSSNHCIKEAKKNIDESEEPDYIHTIRNITACKGNNGCSGYLVDDGEVSLKKKNNILTIASDAAYGGICFYQDQYIVSTGHNNMLEIKNSKFKKVLDNNTICYLFLSKMISKVLCIRGINRFERPIGNDFGREIILLPCIEVDDEEEYIWEVNKKCYTFANNYVNYIYLTSQIDYYDKLMHNYKGN